MCKNQKFQTILKETGGEIVFIDQLDKILKDVVGFTEEETKKVEKVYKTKYYPLMSSYNRKIQDNVKDLNISNKIITSLSTISKISESSNELKPTHKSSEL